MYVTILMSPGPRAGVAAVVPVGSAHAWHRAGAGELLIKGNEEKSVHARALFTLGCGPAVDDMAAIASVTDTPIHSDDAGNNDATRCGGATRPSLAASNARTSADDGKRRR